MIGGMQLGRAASMSQDDGDTDAFLERRSRQLMSFAVYRKLKAIVESWEREERGKARVAAGALYGLLLWFALLAGSALVLPAYAPLISIVGFLVWIGFVAALIRKHLGTPRSSS